MGSGGFRSGTRGSIVHIPLRRCCKSAMGSEWVPAGSDMHNTDYIREEQIAVFFCIPDERAFIVFLRDLRWAISYLSSQSPSIAPNHHPITS